ncbi:hypothetical protein D3C87_2153240 [compost metagenome]
MLGDNNKPEDEQFILAKQTNMEELFGNMNGFEFDDEVSYELNDEAFAQAEAYRKIYRRISL